MPKTMNRGWLRIRNSLIDEQPIATEVPRNEARTALSTVAREEQRIEILRVLVAFSWSPVLFSLP